MWQQVVLAVFLCSFVGLDCLVEAAEASGDTFTIRVLHHNDFYSRFDGAEVSGKVCSKNDDPKCFGRIARWQKTTDDILKSSSDTIFLYAGDMFQGSLYSMRYGSEVAADLTRNINYTAFSLGSHEFENGIKQLEHFLTNVNFDVTCVNLDAPKHPELKKLVKKSIIKEVNGKKIGIIGFVIPKTVLLSQTGDIKFTNEIKAIRTEARRLKKHEKVDLIFIVGQSGIEKDKEIAEKVKEVDLVVGGHANTFLYNGAPPKEVKLTPDGPYPILVKQAGGKVVPVVQVYPYGVFLGDLTLVFSSSNNGLVSATGQPVLMNAEFGIDPYLQVEVDSYTEEIEKFKKKVIGHTTIELEGERKQCRLRECTFGNYLSDYLEIFAIEKLTMHYTVGKQWVGYPITIFNSGVFKQSIRTGNITVGDVMKALPYPNDVYLLTVSGEVLLLTLQRAVDQIKPSDPEGRFLQFSGLQVVYNVSRPPGDRLVSVKARCWDCLVPSYKPIDVNASYPVMMNDYIASGGDGFSMLKNATNINTGFRLVDLAMESFARKPVFTELNNRIQVLNSSNITDESAFTGTLYAKLNVE